jgi:hypothetical protein
MNRSSFHTIHALGILLVCLFLILLFCVGMQFVFEAPFTLAFGWPRYLWRVIPQLHPDPGSFAAGVVCLVGFTLGAHAFLRWLYGVWGTEEGESLDKKPRRWQWRRTMQLVGLFVLMFVSGIAVTGMIHQTGWLIQSPEPLLHNSWDDRAVSVSGNNLKQICLAAHSYQDADGDLPKSTFDATGGPMHSWQTALLPYVEQSSLYNQIDLTKPWTDPANANEMFKTHKEFVHPSVPYEPVNGYGASHYAGNVHIVLGDTPKKMSDFPQGTSNVIWAGEVAANFRAWGDPLNARDPRLRASGQPNGFGGPNGKPAQFVMLDGSVRTFDSKELAELMGKVPE